MKILSNLKRLNVMFAVMLALSVGVITGCDDQGPAEEAGENLDESVEEAADAMEDAADEAEDEIDDATDGG